MIEWFAALLILGLIQLGLYQISVARLVKASLLYGALLFMGLCLSELLRRIFWSLELEWWLPVVTVLVAYLLGEWTSVLFSVRFRELKRSKQSAPSFSTLSLFFVMLAWLDRGHYFAFGKACLIMLLLSGVGVSLLIVLAGILERLEMSEVQKDWEGLPILILSAALLLIVLHGFPFEF